MVCFIPKKCISNFKKIRRKEGDDVFLEAMEVIKKSWFVRRPMWLGVRAGGWKAWNDHRKAGHPK